MEHVDGARASSWHDDVCRLSGALSCDVGARDPGCGRDLGGGVDGRGPRSLDGMDAVPAAGSSPAGGLSEPVSASGAVPAPGEPCSGATSPASAEGFRGPVWIPSPGGGNLCGRGLCRDLPAGCELRVCGADEGSGSSGSSPSRCQDRQDGLDAVCQANWRKVGGESPLKRRSNQTTFLREPCVGSREGAGEASVAVRMGRANEHRKVRCSGCRGFRIGRRQHRRHRFGEMSASPAVSENPCTSARLLLGPWEVFELSRLSWRDRVGKGESRSL